MSIVRIIILFIICGGLTIILQFGFIFLLLALLPAIVAYFTDTSPGRAAFKIVAAGNISATLPTLIPMLKTGMKMKHYDTTNAMTDPKVWMFIYLGAAAGWALIYLCRYIARFIVTVTFEYNIKALQNEQILLVEEWGREITQSPNG